MFPVIKHIDDIWPLINHKPEFYLAQRDGYQVINYMVSTPTTFDSPLAIEARGIMFDLEGNIIRRPLHKFFNYGEKPVEDERLDFQGARILEKIDGSMIAPFIVARDGKNARKGGTIRLGTKMGLTDVALQAEEFIKDKPNYHEFIGLSLMFGYTPIFEWTSRKQRIVIDYEEDNLILLAMRDMFSGAYMHYPALLINAEEYNVPVVKSFDLNLKNMNELQEHTKGLQNQEGFVVVFSNDQRVKLKADEYLRIHRAKDQITSEKNVLNLIFNENIDDIVPHLLNEDQEKILKFEADVLKSVENSAIVLTDTIKMFKKMYPTRKDYGLNVSNSDRYDTMWSSVRNTIAFKVYDRDFDSHDVRMELIDYIKKNISSSTKIDGIRHILGFNRWNYNEVVE